MTSKPVKKRRQKMEKLIELQWIRDNRIHKKKITRESLEDALGEKTELISLIEPISEIEYIYINFDRNKKKKKSSMWIKYLQKDGETNIDIEQYKMFYNKVSRFCE